MRDSTVYKKEWFDNIINEICRQFSIEQKLIPNVQQRSWRVAIKRLFDQNILIDEIISAIPQASKKMYWPTNTAFFHRIEDVVYLNRKKRERVVKVNEGLTKLSFTPLLPPTGHDQA